MEIGRFAPTTSGRAHPGTLLSGMLAWLDIRSRGGRFILRMEDIDPGAGDRAKKDGLLHDLEWFGLTWDELVWQSSRISSHEAALDRLARSGLLYECNCGRTAVRRAGLPSVAGGWVYPGTCRSRRVRNWRRSRENLRLDLSDWTVDVRDESGLDLGQTISSAMGDPLVRRPDGSATYQLAVVVDDAESGVTRVVRGRDLATSTATQVALRQILGYQVPAYRHHLLLMEPRGDKLAKLHQSIAVDLLCHHYAPDELRGVLAYAAGLHDRADAPGMVDLLGDFSWEKVDPVDRTLTWDGLTLTLS